MIVICVQTLAPTTGSGLFTNDVINLKHQGAGQKLMIGWHKHQGVSDTLKNADVIYEQPLTFTLFVINKGRTEARPWWAQQQSGLEPGMAKLSKLN